MGVLNRILEQKRSELARWRTARLPAPPVRRPVRLARVPGQGLRLICEIKRRSPSAGRLSAKLGITERARAYERGGAAMVSVLCDTEFFDGAYEHLSEARAGCSLPLLCKEFVIDEAQLDAARAYGADAVLLIARCVDVAQLSLLVRAARERELEPFVEIASEQERRHALDTGATLIGVNARDLDTLAMDVQAAARLLDALPADVTAAHFSGLHGAPDVARVARSRADAALVGEALMRLDDPEPLLRELVSAALPEDG